MTYVSFSLKYRPQRFDEIVGQEHVSRTLVNAIASDRLVHGYLFSGPRGTGKTSTARVLAKALNCVKGPTSEPCCECEFCVAIQQGRAMDVIEIDAASNRGIDEIRELREKVKYSPAEARSKIYILDEVHMLTPEAFNALLKTLEEPPDHSYFVLATTEPHNVPATIMSRCQRFDFRPIPVPQITEALADIAAAEGVDADRQALQAIARAGDGAMRDAQSILDQVVAYTDDNIDVQTVNDVLGVTDAETLAEIGDLMADNDLPGLFAVVDRLISEGKDVGQLMEDLTMYIRDLLRLSLGSEPPVWTLPGDDGQARMNRQAQTIGTDRLMDAIDDLTEAQSDLRSSSQPSLLLELTAAKLCDGQGAPSETDTEQHQKQQAGTQQPTDATGGTQKPAGTGGSSNGSPQQSGKSPSGTKGGGGAGPVVDEAPTLDVIKKHWSLLPDELKRMKHLPVGPIIAQGEPISFSDGKLTVGFSSEYTFHYNQARSNYRDVIQEALERIFGEKIALDCRLIEADPATAAEDASDTQEQSQQAPETSDDTNGQQTAMAEAPAGDSAETKVSDQSHQRDDADEQQTDEADQLDEVVKNTLDLFEGSKEIEADE